MVKKRIVLLANSIKHGERCLAGRELKPDGSWGGWIRPVSARVGEGLNELERHYEGHVEPRLLDVIDTRLVQPNPHSCQSENWLVSSSGGWTHCGRLDWAQASHLAEIPHPLWRNGRNTWNGLNDEMLASHADTFPTSICLIRIPRGVIRVLAGYNNQPKVVVKFVHANTEYQFSLTDSILANKYKTGQKGEAEFGESLLTISLAEPFMKTDGSVCQFKLVAAIIPKSGAMPDIK